MNEWNIQPAKKSSLQESVCWWDKARVAIKYVLRKPYQWDKETEHINHRVDHFVKISLRKIIVHLIPAMTNDKQVSKAAGIAM